MNGFTLIELLIVIAIALILTAAVFPIYGNLQVSSQINENADILIQTVRTARQNAVSGLNNSNYGVKFQANSYILYQGQSYAARQSAYDRTISLGNALALSTTLNNNEVNFSKGLGQPDNTGAITLTHNLNETKTVTINSLGTVDQQ